MFETAVQDKRTDVLWDVIALGALWRYLAPDTSSSPSCLFGEAKLVSGVADELTKAARRRGKWIAGNPA
jgi:hypothetical protein